MYLVSSLVLMYLIDIFTVLGDYISFIEQAFDVADGWRSLSTSYKGFSEAPKLTKASSS